MRVKLNKQSPKENKKGTNNYKKKVFLVFRKCSIWRNNRIVEKFPESSHC
jgi:hypothetical protein